LQSIHGSGKKLRSGLPWENTITVNIHLPGKKEEEKIP